MFCLKCGARLDDNATFCPACGAAQKNTAPPSTGARPFGTPTPTSSRPNNSPINGSDLPMNWFKFLIYFGLFAGPLLNAINGFRMVTGSIYDGSENYVYAFFDGLETLDKIVGLGLIAVAALGIYARFRLAGFLSDGPKMLMMTYAGVVVVGLIYIIGIYMVLPSGTTEYLDLTTNFVNIGVSAAMIFVNKAYFDKRAHMFKN